MSGATDVSESRAKALSVALSVMEGLKVPHPARWVVRIHSDLADEEQTECVVRVLFWLDGKRDACVVVRAFLKKWKTDGLWRAGEGNVLWYRHELARWHFECREDGNYLVVNGRLPFQFNRAPLYTVVLDSENSEDYKPRLSEPKVNCEG